MIRNSIKDDMNFRNRCWHFGLDSENFNIIGDMIVLNTSKNNIIVILDEHYNIVGVYDRKEDINKLVNDVKSSYENTNNKLPFPFQNLSLKQIIELANRVDICGTNHGHSSTMYVNGEWVIDENKSVYISLLSYISFLGKHIEQYYINQYQMKMIGLEYPDIYKYLSSLANSIEECVNIYIEKGKRPFPIDIIKYIGIDAKSVEEYNHELYRIIELLLGQKNLKIQGGFDHYKDLAKTNKEKINLEEKSNDLLKILEVSKEEVDARIKESNKKWEWNTINLEAWLTEKNKSLVLK